jgi:2-(1,2-epoxy-1,2-dihydrophenyl)acetyl-CoA isomerase
MSYDRIKLSFEDGVARLTLAHPQVLNAVSIRMLEELSDALSEIEDPANGARCVVLTGDGRGFCAGANLSDTDRGERTNDGAGSVLETHYHPLLLRFRGLNVPLITSVNGVAAGVGMSFALMGDIVLAGKGAYFLQAFKRIGLVPDGGSTYLLPRLIGLSRAMELSMLAEKLPAEKALEWGLINRVYDDDTLAAETTKFAHELATGPTKTFGLIRQLYWASPGNTYEEQLNLEAKSQNIAGASADSREGVQAFLEKRPANFKGE